MIIDILDLIPDNARTEEGCCYSCLGCPHLQAVNIDSSHNAYIECDIDDDNDDDNDV